MARPSAWRVVMHAWLNRRNFELAFLNVSRKPSRNRSLPFRVPQVVFQDAGTPRFPYAATNTCCQLQEYFGLILMSRFGTAALFLCGIEDRPKSGGCQ